MKMMNKHVESTLFQINNTLEMLYGLGFLRSYNPMTCKVKDDIETLTWDNHVPGRHNAGDSFATINQYVTIYESGAYHGIVNDGSIIRASYSFKKNILVGQSLLFWPAPINIPEEDIEELGIREAMHLHLSSLNCDSKELRMRTPMRVDFDPQNASDVHPDTHVHMQHSECRISAKKPICFNTFIKFIISNIYPTLSLNLRSLECINYSGYEKKSKLPSVINI